MRERYGDFRALFALVLGATLLSGPASFASTPQAVDDALLFSTSVAPNVLILMDTSGSMDTVVYHPAYDAGDSGATCSFFWTGQTFSSTQTDWEPGWMGPGCVDERTIPVDPVNDDPVSFDADYLNWYFSPAADAYADEIAGATVDLSCIGESYLAYGRSRITAAKQILREVICQVNKSGEVRFGLARFRYEDGGYVVVPVGPYSEQQDQDLDDAITGLVGDGWTPLAESLFQIYTYFMNRSQLPGVAGTLFPGYDFELDGDYSSSASVSDPVLAYCQKNFVIIITDGLPTHDGFESDGNVTQKFSDVDDLIGSYDSEDFDGSYLNHIAKFMHNFDFRPDLEGDQFIDVYAVGFTTGDDANALLERTALVGGGDFHQSDDPEELSAALVDTLSSIISKAQSFTAATVPASRTTDGDNIYMSYFIPKARDPFWPGHLANFEFTASGEIRDANGNCAVDDGDPAVCEGGQLDPAAVPFWDAADQVPTPGGRHLYVSVTGVSANALPPAFDDAHVDATALGVSDSDLSSYPDSNAADAAGLAREIVAYTSGCVFGDAACSSVRSELLGDIFHSNPVVVGPPNAPVNDSSYREFARKFSTRSRVIYAGANDGFVHGFHAGAYDPGPPATYTRGTGEELFGFMPWEARKTIKHFPIDLPPRDHYYVDGSPQVTDVWFYGAPDQTTDSRSWHEWHTILVGGLRQGGASYYALDVTNPDQVTVGNTGYPPFPAYLWEFPCEADVAHCNAVRPYMGESWGDPIITRVRVTVDCSADCPTYERWVAIVTGGYHPSGDPNDFASYDPDATAGRAIFMIDVVTGEVLAEKKFDGSLPSSDPESQMRYAIASRPAVFDLDFDGYADVIYVGDLGGNLWKWVVRAAGGDPINGTGAADLASQPNWTFKKFFAAPSYTDASSGDTFYKSIFFAPTGTIHHGQLLLGFATGERANLEADWLPGEEGDNNRIYVMSDLDPFEGLATPFATLTEADLEDLTDSSNCLDAATYRGYYVVGRDGEKFVTNSSIFLGDFFTGSFIPTSGADPCASGGEAFLYRIVLSCGEGAFDPATAGSTQPADLRRVKIGTGLPAPPRFSVGPLTDGSSPPGPNPPPPPCQNRVLVLTSDGRVSNQCAGVIDDSGVNLHTWRQRD